MYPSSVFLSPGSTESLQVTGTFADGVDRDLSDVPGMIYVFGEGHATHSPVNAVTLNVAAEDSFTVAYQGVVSSSVPVHPLPPLPPQVRKVHRRVSRK